MSSKTIPGNEGKESIDIEKNSRYAELIRAEAISKLAGGVAHDLNNFLAPIISYAELALGDLSEDEVLYYDMEQILEAARCAHGLSRQLLTFCKKQNTDLTILNLNNCIFGAKKMLRRLLRENIILDFRLQEGLDGVLLDPSHVDQILINMTVNAQDAMIEGGKFTIETAHVDIDESFVRIHPDAPMGPKIMISFTDNGIGMNEKVVSRIFDRGFTTRGGAGSGFGLSTVQDIVRLARGYIQVFSQEGHGTSFKLYFPRVVGSYKVDSRQNKEPVFRGNGEYLLIVDDEEPVRRLATRILDRVGYNVLEADGAETALRIVLQRKGKIDLILSDLIMPGMNGVDLYKEIRTLFPDINVLFMSGYEAEVVRQYGVISPKYLFLHKPFSIGTLTRKIYEALLERT